MVSRDVACWMEDFTAIGSQLRSNWLEGEFHAPGTLQWWAFRAR